MAAEPRKVLKGVITEEKIKKAFEKLTLDSELAMEGFRYELILEDRYQDVLNFYRDHFVPDEPVGRCIGLSFVEELETLVASELRHNMSLALVSASSGEIIGVRINSIISKNDLHDTSQIKSEKMKIIEEFLIYLGDLNNIFDHYGVEDAVHFFGIGIHREYRGNGFGTQLMKAAIALFKNLEIGGIVIKGEGSSNYSKRIYEKFDFDILAEVVYADYKVDGVVVFQNLGEHKYERLYGKVV